MALKWAKNLDGRFASSMRDNTVWLVSEMLGLNYFLYSSITVLDL